jgi:hypothetical protein
VRRRGSRFEIAVEVFVRPDRLEIDQANPFTHRVAQEIELTERAEMVSLLGLLIGCLRYHIQRP